MRDEPTSARFSRKSVVTVLISLCCKNSFSLNTHHASNCTMAEKANLVYFPRTFLRVRRVACNSWTAWVRKAKRRNPFNCPSRLLGVGKKFNLICSVKNMLLSRTFITIIKTVYHLGRKLAMIVRESPSLGDFKTDIFIVGLNIANPLPSKTVSAVDLLRSVPAMHIQDTWETMCR